MDCEVAQVVPVQLADLNKVLGERLTHLGKCSVGVRDDPHMRHRCVSLNGFGKAGEMVFVEKDAVG